MRSRRPLRIHVLIDSLNWGGAETLLAEYADGAERAGASVSVAYLSDRPGAEERLRDRGIEPELLAISGLLSRDNRKRMRVHLRAVNPDVLHTHLGYSDFYGGLAARSLGIPMFSTLHTMDDASGMRQWAQSKLMSWVRRRAAYRVIAVSDALRNHYVEAGYDRPGHVVTVRNGIVGEARPGAGEAVRSELGIGAEELVIAMVSVLRSGKGHDIAAEAVGRLSGDHPNLRLLVLGTGPDRAEIEQTMSPLGDKVLMPGHRDDVLSVLDAVDVLIHPSRADALPTALIEAMAAGVPVVATRVGGIPEIVEEGVTGLLIDAPPRAVDLAASIGRLLGDRDLRERFAVAGRSRFEAEFTVDRWFERLMPLYEAGVAARTPSRGLQPLEAAD